MQYIAISGTVGAGKTTLLRRLSKALGARAAVHEERPDENPYISEYYADAKRWTFHAQATFLSQYFDDYLPPQADKEFYLYDRSLQENLLLCRYRLDQGDLTMEEYEILCKLANGIAALMPPIDKYIYLACSPLTIEDHMFTRGREYEENLDLFYVYEVKKLYDAWYRTLPPEKTLVVDMDKGYELEDILRFLET